MSKLHEGIRLPATFDAHVHLRSGIMMEAVVPTIRHGGKLKVRLQMHQFGGALAAGSYAYLQDFIKPSQICG